MYNRASRFAKIVFITPARVGPATYIIDDGLFDNIFGSKPISTTLL